MDKNSGTTKWSEKEGLDDLKENYMRLRLIFI